MATETESETETNLESFLFIANTLKERRNKKSVNQNTIMMNEYSNEESDDDDIAFMIRTLVSKPAKRLETLKTLRKTLKRRQSKQQLIPIQLIQQFFDVLNNILNHNESILLTECLSLVIEVIPSLLKPSSSERPLLVDALMVNMVPTVVSHLSSLDSAVVRTAQTLLHVYMRHTNNLQKVLKSVIKFGLESRDPVLQKSTVKSVPLMFSEEFSHENLFVLVNSLAKLLICAKTDLFYNVFLSLQRLHSLLGNESFYHYLSQVRNKDEVIAIYSSITENASPSGTAVIGDIADTDSVVNEEQDLSIMYAIIPSNLIFSAKYCDRAEDKCEAIHSIVSLLRESSSHRLSQIIPFFNKFLNEFIVHLLDDKSNIKVNLLSLSMLEVIVLRLKLTLIAFMPSIVLILHKRFGDPRVAVREAVIKTFHHLSFSLPPQQMLDILMEQKPSKNAKSREELICRVICAVSTFPRTEFNLEKLGLNVAPFMTDNRRSVRLAALECLAVIAAALGPYRLGPLMSAAEAIETSCDCEGLVSALRARISRRALPKCNADGSVKYVLRPSSTSNWFVSPVIDADIEWVLLASSNNSANEDVNARRISFIPLDRRRTYKKEELETDLERQSYLENYGVITGPQKEADDERQSRVSSAASAEMWRHYFSEFKRQLAEEALNQSLHSNSVFSPVNTYPDRSTRKAAHHVKPVKEALPVVQSSSSAPSTANSESSIKYLPPLMTTSMMTRSHEERLASLAFAEQNIERSLSMPSIISSAQSRAEDDVYDDMNVEWRPMDEKMDDRHQVVVEDIENNDNQQTIEQMRSEMKREKSHEREYQEFVSKNNDIEVATETTTMDNKTDFELNITELALHEDKTENLGVIEDKVEDEARRPPMVQIQESTPIEPRSFSPEEPLEASKEEKRETAQRLDVCTQKDETLSSETTSEEADKKDKFKTNAEQPNPKSRLPAKKAANGRARLARSTSPPASRRMSRAPQQLYIKTTPAIPANANIRHILANVAKTEGPFDNPNEASKAALMALRDDAWTTKVEGMLATCRLATFHGSSMAKDQHALVGALVSEVRNLRSTVSRSAIFTLGELFARLKTQIEPEMDVIVGALLAKAGENVVFIREDIERALSNLVDEMPQTKAAIALIGNGSNHRNAFVRKISAQFLSTLVERMGATKCLLGPRDIGEHLLPAVARFVQDCNAHTRFYGRKMFAVLQTYQHFDKLLRKRVTPGTYRNIVGILESIKRRGIGDPPTDLTAAAVVADDN